MFGCPRYSRILVSSKQKNLLPACLLFSLCACTPSPPVDKSLAGVYESRDGMTLAIQRGGRFLLVNPKHSPPVEWGKITTRSEGGYSLESAHPDFPEISRVLRLDSNQSEQRIELTTPHEVHIFTPRPPRRRPSFGVRSKLTRLREQLRSDSCKEP